MTQPSRTLANFAFAAALSTVASHGQSIFTENFESLNDGQQLFGDLGTVQSLGQQTGSTLTGQDYGLGAPTNSFGGGETALFYDDTVTTGNQLLLVEDDDFDLAAAYDPTKTTTLSFDYYYESPDGSSNPLQSMNLFITDGVVDTRDGLNLQIYSSLRQVRYAPTGGGTYSVLNGGGQLKVDTWYRFQVKIYPLNTATDTFDLTVIEGTGGFGTVVFEAAGLAIASDIADIAVMEFQGFAGGASTHQAYFDNIDWIEGELPLVVLAENFVALNDDQQLYGQLNTVQSGNQQNGVADWLNGQDYGSGAPGTGFNGEGGSTAVFFDKSAGNNNLRLHEDDGFDLGTAYDATLTTKVYFDFYCDSTTTQVGDFRLFMDDGTNPLENALDLMFFSSIRQVRPSTGAFSYSTPFAVAGGGTQLKSDTWYRYELTIHPLDTATDTYDLTVSENGVGVVISATDIAFDNDIADISRMEFQMFGSTAVAQAYFDNVLITQSTAPSGDLAIVSIDYAPVANTVTLTWTSEPSGSYAVTYSTDLADWTGELGAAITDTDDEVPGDGDQITVTFDLASTPIETADKAFFRVEN